MVLQILRRSRLVIVVVAVAIYLKLILGICSCHNEKKRQGVKNANVIGSTA